MRHRLGLGNAFVKVTQSYTVFILDRNLCKLKQHYITCVFKCYIPGNTHKTALMLITGIESFLLFL